jgi:hypothetical protein
MAVDDLHWADPDSLRMFSFLCQYLKQGRVAFMAAMRPWPPDALQKVRSLADKRMAVLEAQVLSPGPHAVVGGQPVTELIHPEPRLAGGV